MGREFFYLIDGKTKPYHYCTDCGTQYTDEQLQAGEIVNVGSKATPIKYCKTPCMARKLPPEKKKEKSLGATMWNHKKKVIDLRANK